jgi:hypothetical protein
MTIPDEFVYFQGLDRQCHLIMLAKFLVYLIVLYTIIVYLRPCKYHDFDRNTWGHSRRLRGNGYSGTKNLMLCIFKNNMYTHYDIPSEMSLSRSPTEITTSR